MKYSRNGCCFDHSALQLSNFCLTEPELSQTTAPDNRDSMKKITLGNLQTNQSNLRKRNLKDFLKQILATCKQIPGKLRRNTKKILEGGNTLSYKILTVFIITTYFDRIHRYFNFGFRIFHYLTYAHIQRKYELREKQFCFWSINFKSGVLYLSKLEIEEQNKR